MAIILVVDDEPEMLEVIKKFFNRKGFQVIAALRGQEAIKVLESKTAIDLLILDIRMPGIKGIAIMKHMKEKGLNVPVIVLTGSVNSSGFIELMISMGYSENDIFYKPVNLNELLKLVNKKINAQNVKVQERENHS